GLAGDKPVIGDFDNDGVDDIGVVREEAVGVVNALVWYIDTGHDYGVAELIFPYGLAGDKPVIGDFDNDGVDDIGVVREEAVGVVNALVWYIDTGHDYGAAEFIFPYGLAGDKPVIGDFDNDGVDDIGVVREEAIGVVNALVWYIDTGDDYGVAELIFPYGLAGDKPVIGDFDGK
ncbi:MAG: VCBS repeat-containing protein, partial [Proteobacteria bacterium]|nr:VCBS repeat-containing protein [Pseudomonadota bacterium]